MASSNNDANISVPLSPNARLYSYFILLGVARGEIIVGHLKRYDMPALMAIDKETRNAVIHNHNLESLKTDYQADQKLVAYLLFLRQH